MVDFAHLSWDLLVARLALAAALGALVGLERERHDRPAGLRTHLLVSAGSCLFTLISMAMAGPSYDPARLAAGIITGLGFLGAGTIIRHGGSVQGLTTAASIWAVAGVGMAAAIGWWEAALIGTGLMYLSLAGLKAIEARLHPVRETLVLRVELDHTRLSLTALHAALKGLGYQPSEVELRRGGDGRGMVAVVELPEVPRERAAEVMERLAGIPGVLAVATL